MTAIETHYGYMVMQSGFLRAKSSMLAGRTRTSYVQNSPVTPAQVIANKGSVRARGYCRLRLPPAGGSLSLLIEGKKTRWVLNSLELCLHTSEPGGSHEPTSNATQDAQAPPRYSECGLSGGL